MCTSPTSLTMYALDDAREPLVVTFPVPPGLDAAGMHLLIEAWYEAIAAYNIVYVGGTSFALNPPCPTADTARQALQRVFGHDLRVDVLSSVLQARRGAPAEVFEAA
jgi:hypothetical protein